jgi:hypothetical protein
MAGTDAVWTVALWAIVTAVSWGADGQVRRRTALAVLGAGTAIAVEWAALADGRWTYNALMPIIPVLNVGLWPVVQISLLPVMSVVLAAAWRR